MTTDFIKAILPRLRAQVAVKRHAARSRVTALEKEASPRGPEDAMGVVTRGELQDRFKRLSADISALGLLIQHAQLVGDIGLIEYANYTSFQIVWLDYFVANYPQWSPLYPDSAWDEVEAYNQDYLKWRAIYEQATGSNAPPATQPKETPKTQPGGGGLGGFGDRVDKTLDTARLAAMGIILIGGVFLIKEFRR